MSQMSTPKRPIDEDYATDRMVMEIYKDVKNPIAGLSVKSVTRRICSKFRISAKGQEQEVRVIMNRLCERNMIEHVPGTPRLRIKHVSDSSKTIKESSPVKVPTKRGAWPSFVSFSSPPKKRLSSSTLLKAKKKTGLSKGHSSLSPKNLAKAPKLDKGEKTTAVAVRSSPRVVASSPRKLSQRVRSSTKLSSNSRHVPAADLSIRHSSPPKNLAKAPTLDKVKKTTAVAVRSSQRVADSLQGVGSLGNLSQLVHSSAHVPASDRRMIPPVSAAMLELVRPRLAQRFLSPKKSSPKKRLSSSAKIKKFGDTVSSPSGVRTSARVRSLASSRVRSSEASQALSNSSADRNIRDLHGPPVGTSMLLPGASSQGQYVPPLQNPSVLHSSFQCLQKLCERAEKLKADVQGLADDCLELIQILKATL